jgi:hypothetical protein
MTFYNARAFVLTQLVGDCRKEPLIAKRPNGAPLVYRFGLCHGSAYERPMGRVGSSTGGSLSGKSTIFCLSYRCWGGHIADGMCMVPQRYRPSFLHMRLRHSVSDQDNKTEALAASFIGSSDSEQVSLLRYSATDSERRQLTM